MAVVNILNVLPLHFQTPNEQIKIIALFEAESPK
jgi:hypothetical protein